MNAARRTSRGKPPARSDRQLELVAAPGADQACDCPVCSGGGLDPRQLLTDLVDGAAGLAPCEDPLDAEFTGALVVALVDAVGDDTASPWFAESLVPAIEARATDTALMILTAIASAAGAGPEPVARAAAAAAARLANRGIPVPAWARDLREPLRPGSFTRLYDTDGTMSVLAGTFHRAGREHAVMIAVDHDHCGAAEDIFVLDAADLPTAMQEVHDGGRGDGLTIRSQTITAPEFRWYAEQAMDARAVHDDADRDGGALDPAEMFDDEGEGPGYPVLAVIARTRLAALPKPRKPKGATEPGHPDDDGGLDELAVLQQFAQMIDAAGGPVALRLATLPGGQVALTKLPAKGPAKLPAKGLAKLPAKRRKNAGPAPVYQIKISLSGANPPIWRRLLVPADVSLARLHTTILAAFGWHGGHMHVFETAYGDFGHADRELGHRADTSVTLEQVAPGAKRKLRYTYDFGDDWVHDILVEKVLVPDPATSYPRCTGGKRAAPPDDCGGIWGYQELAEILADPAHPEHDERLDWLGLDDASQFTPDAFEPDEVNRRLGTAR